MKWKFILTRIYDNENIYLTALKRPKSGGKLQKRFIRCESVKVKRKWGDMKTKEKCISAVGR